MRRRSKAIPPKRKAETRGNFPAFRFGFFEFRPRVSRSVELPGLSARLDKLCYHHGGASLPADKPHAFVYFITIRNGSDRAVTLLGRKWVVHHADGTQLVIEGDGIVGETPHLAPGEEFSYNSYHVTGTDASAHGSFHGVDELGKKIHVILPPFEMLLPRG
jgi:ApaG protein